jgi:hypothetical protein
VKSVYMYRVIKLHSAVDFLSQELRCEECALRLIVDVVLFVLGGEARQTRCTERCPHVTCPDMYVDLSRVCRFISCMQIYLVYADLSHICRFISCMQIYLIYADVSRVCRFISCMQI